MLANYEQQMQFDPNANYSENFAYKTREVSQIVPREINREKCKLKLKKTNGTPNKEKCAGGAKEEEEKGEVNDEIISELSDSDDVGEIILEVDPFVSCLPKKFYT
jgi:hypothetical protein